MFSISRLRSHRHRAQLRHQGDQGDLDAVATEQHGAFRPADTPQAPGQLRPAAEVVAAQQPEVAEAEPAVPDREPGPGHGAGQGGQGRPGHPELEAEHQPHPEWQVDGVDRQRHRHGDPGRAQPGVHALEGEGGGHERHRRRGCAGRRRRAASRPVPPPIRPSTAGEKVNSARPVTRPPATPRPGRRRRPWPPRPRTATSPARPLARAGGLPPRVRGTVATRCGLGGTRHRWSGGPSGAPWAGSSTRPPPWSTPPRGASTPGGPPSSSPTWPCSRPPATRRPRPASRLIRLAGPSPWSFSCDWIP